MLASYLYARFYLDVDSCLSKYFKRGIAMIFSYYEVNKLPVMVIDKLYDKLAEEKIMQELFFLNNDPRKLKNPEDSGSAWDPDESLPGGKRYLKKNKAHSLDTIFMDRSASNILTENRKLFTEEITSELLLRHPIFRFVKYANSDATLVSYYENEDYYLPHRDDATMTALTWFYKSPKAFSGGELILEESLEIECVSNRCIIFPSIALHSVKQVRIDADKTNLNLGRFTISQFLSYRI